MATKKDVAWSYFEHLQAGDVEAALAVLDDSGTWWSSVYRHETPMTKFKETTASVVGLMPFSFVLHHAVEEGDTVVLEVESHATRPDGQAYNNVYVFIFTIPGDRILHAREHTDTKYAHEAFPPEAWEHEDRGFDTGGA